MKSIFITGATGFLGSHVLDALHAENFKVIATTRDPRLLTPDNALHKRTEWVSSKDAASVIGSLKPHAIIHLATDYGQTSQLQETELANVVWPLSLLEAGINAGTEIFINTDSFFGKPEFNYPHMRPYTLSKTHFVEWGKLATKATRTRFITLRLEHVFGENDRLNKFIPSLLQKLSNGETISATVGTQKRDFVYAGDVANAFTTVLNKYDLLDTNIHEIEVGNGKSVTVRAFVQLAKHLTRSCSLLIFGAIPMRENEIMDSSADVGLLRILGWVPKVSLEDGLRRCIEGSKNTDKILRTMQ